MAEIPRSFFTRSSRSDTPVSAPGRVPQTPQLGRGAFGVEADAAAQLGQTTQQVGAALLQRAQQVRQQKEAVQAAEALTRASIDLELLSAEVEQDPEIFPTDRVDALKDQGLKLIAERVGRVEGKRAQAEVGQRLGTALASRLGALARTSQSEFEARSAGAFDVAATELQGQLLRAQSGEERRAIVGNLRAIGAGLVASGALNQSDVSKRLVAVQEGAQIDRMQLLIGADPRTAERHLHRLALGEEGVAGFPDVPLDQVRTLLDDARASRRHSQADERRDERAIEKEEADAQEATSISLRAQLFADTAGVETMRQVIRDANALATGPQRLLDEGSHSALLNTARAMIDNVTNGSTTRDVATLNQITAQVFGDSLPPDALRAIREELVEEVAAFDISRTDALPLLRELDSRLSGDHYSKVAEYGQAVRFIRDVVGFGEEGLAVLNDTQREIRQRGARALVIFSQAMGDTYQRGGRDAVAREAFSTAEQLIETFGVSSEAQLDTFPIPPVLRPFVGVESVEERYKLAFKALTEDQEMSPRIKAETFRLLEQRKAMEAAREARLRPKQTQKAPSGPGFIQRGIDAISEGIEKIF